MVIPTVTPTVASTVDPTAAPVQGVSYGPDLLTNGGFASDLSSWTVNGTSPAWVWASSDGKGVALLVGTPTTGTRSLTQTITVENGETYRIDANMVKGSAFDLQINAEGGTVIEETTQSGDVTRSGEFTAVGTSATIEIITVDNDFYFDNVNWITVRKKQT